MGANPGFGGQAVIVPTLRKMTQVRKFIDALGRNVRLAVDGCVKVENIRQTAGAGADTFVAGSKIFGAPSYSDGIVSMCKVLEGQHGRESSATLHSS